MELETIDVFVQRVIYANQTNGFQVLDVLQEEEERTVVGIFHGPMQGLSLRVTGYEEYKPEHGWQFTAKQYEILEPDDEEAVRRYLGSGAIKGVGETLAGRIVKLFGADTMRIMEQEPERLAQVKGISMRMAQEIAVQVMEKRDMRSAMMFLQKYGISNTLAVKIYNTYGEGIYSIVKENPYKMSEDIEGIGFLTADAIAEQVGIRVDSDYRIRSGILYVLSGCMGEGHTYIPEEELISRACQLLRVPGEQIIPHIANLMMDKKLVKKNDQIYSTYAFYAENNVAVMLLGLSQERINADWEKVDAKIARIEQAEGIVLDTLQREAVHDCVNNGVFLLTGGPGTGKTTTINVIIRYFLQEGYNLALAAPTGRAAKRMTEATGYEASTIHRLLGVGGAQEGENAYFEYNEENRLPQDVIIIDEMSMVDIFLFQSLLKAICRGTRLILVGDRNQLPSVGPGQVLGDIVQSDLFACVELKKIFRQAESSDIIVNAHRIREGKEIKLDNDSRDFFFLQRADVALIYNNIVKLVTEKMPRYVGADPIDVQVMTPMRKGALGVETLNAILQKYVNPPAPGKREHAFGEKLLREQDKVMQTKNNYKLEWEIVSKYNIPIEKGCGIFNGDVGRILEIREFDKVMRIVFDDNRQVEYPFELVDELELAYAITVHKSQGSEYPAVVLPLLGVPNLLAYRNLLYTAVTRGRKCVTILGSKETIDRMIANGESQKRYSGLADRLKEYNERMEMPD